MGLCSVCGIGCKIKHLKEHSEVDHFCETCGKHYISSLKFYKHIKNYHANKNLQCEECLKTFLTKANLNPLVKTFQSLCEKCAKSFNKRSNLKRHQSTCQITKGKLYVTSVHRHFLNMIV